MRQSVRGTNWTSIEKKKLKEHDRRTWLYKAVNRFGGTRMPRPSGRVNPNILARKPRPRDRRSVKKKNPAAPQHEPGRRILAEYFVDGPNPFPTIKKAAGFLQARNGLTIIKKVSLHTTTQCSLHAGTEDATVSGHIISTYPTGEPRKKSPSSEILNPAGSRPSYPSPLLSSCYWPNTFKLCYVTGTFLRQYQFSIHLKQFCLPKYGGSMFL
jgi:hypothetical protein